MRPSEAAQELGVSVKTVYYWIHRPEMEKYVTTTKRGIKMQKYELSPEFVEVLKKSEVPS